MQLYIDSPDAMVFTSGRVLVLVWRSKVEETGLEAVERALRDLQAAFGRGLFLLTVVGDAPVPGRAERKRLEAFMRSGNGVLVASVAAYTAKGIRAAIIRQVAYALALSARTTYRHEPVDSVERAVVWLEVNAGLRGGQELRMLLASMGVM